jgi:alpha-beta hydrolase superfamily lysophospholipase
METLEWSWNTADGLTLWARGWKPVRPKATVCLVHGHGEHVGRYEHVAAALAQRDYALMGFDLRGHGRSGGARGHTPSYEALLEDIDEFCRQVAARQPGLPRFLYGHSMGGNLVINYALRRRPNLRGVIATGPWLELAFQPPPLKVALGKLMNRLAPSFTQASGLETKALAHDAAVVQAYENDPLVHGQISARLFIAMYEAGQWALQHAAEFPLPLLLMHGDADRLTSAEASRRFAAAAPQGICTLRLWPGFYHEIHNEPEKEQVLQVLLDWLDTHLA